MTIKKRILIFIAVVVTTGFVLVALALYTSKGSQVVVETVLRQYTDEEDVSYKSLEGHLMQGMTFENLKLQDLKYFPKGSVLLVQKISIDADALGISGLNVHIENGRLKMPHSDTIVINGDFQGGQLDLNIYSNTIDLGDVFDTASVEGTVRKISGKIENVDVYVKGDYTRPVVSGKLELALLSYEQFSLKEAPVDFNLQLKDIFKDIKLNGKVNVTRGNILSRRTKVQLEESYLVFEGAPVNPRFNIRGKSDIEKTKINISVKGTKEDPDLWLSSEPPLPKEQLMVMLATGKRWKGVETSLKNEQLSDEVADDFVDYFLFSGQGKKLAEHFGIKELSITYTQDTRGLGVKKSLTDKLDIGYGVEKSVEQNKEEPSRIKQKLEGEYNLNEKLSIGVQKEIMYDNKDTVEEQEVPEPVADDRVFMKFKTKF